MMQDQNYKPSILIVDDTPTNIQVLAETLRADYRIKVATNGQAALDIVGGNKPDLILLDVMMAGMDGYEVCRRLKENPDTQEIPVIFVTARNDAQDEEHGLRLGAMDYIAKPFQPAIVKARVRNHINLKMKTDLLESLALIDGLTGIPNRRRLDEALDMEWKRGLRAGTPLALAMADVDCFKAYNDHYGHGAGDECLKAVARALSSSLSRPADMMARYGGEEFVILMPDTPLAPSIEIMVRLQRELTKTFFMSGKENILITFSAGVAQLGKDETGIEAINRADQAMYLAKRAGKNRVMGG